MLIRNAFFIDYSHYRFLNFSSFDENACCSIKLHVKSLLPSIRFSSINKLCHEYKALLTNFSFGLSRIQLNYDKQMLADSSSFSIKQRYFNENEDIAGVFNKPSLMRVIGDSYFETSFNTHYSVYEFSISLLQLLRQQMETVSGIHWSCFYSNICCVI